jgi:hypothetical protein
VGFAEPTGYIINFSGQFGTIDLATGVFTLIATLPPNSAGGIGGAPGGPFYVDGVTGHLMRITPTGIVTDIGDTGTGPSVGPNGISVLGSLTTGAIYALDFSNRLLSINTATGKTTFLKTLPLPPQEPGYFGTMVTSFNGDSEHLYYSIEIAEGLPNTTGPTLFEIDPITLRITGSTRIKKEPDPIIGSGFVGDGLCAFTVFGEILALNTNSGVTKVTAHYDSGATATNPGPPFTGIFGVVDSQPVLGQSGGKALSEGCKGNGP